MIREILLLGNPRSMKPKGLFSSSKQLVQATVKGGVYASAGARS